MTSSISLRRPPRRHYAGYVAFEFSYAACHFVISAPIIYFSPPRLATRAASHNINDINRIFREN